MSRASRRRRRRSSDLQRPDGHWVFELEADATIPAEYVLLRHYLGEAGRSRARSEDRRLPAPHPGRAWRLAAVPRRRFRHERQREGLFRAQDDRRFSRRRSHAARARGHPRPRRRRRQQRLHAHRCSRSTALCRGEACRSCRSRSCCCRPGFLSTSPRFRIGRSTVIVPLLVLQALKPKARNPKGVTIDELFVAAAGASCASRPRLRTRSGSGSSCSAASTPCFAWPSRSFQRARASARSTRPWLSSPSGSTAKTALARSSRRWRTRVMMFDALGYPKDHPERQNRARAAIDKLLVIKPDEAYCQPCVSPVWDTVLACHALMEAGEQRAVEQRRQGSRLAEAPAGSGCCRRLGGATAGRSSRRLGLPIRQPALSGSR